MVDLNCDLGEAFGNYPMPQDEILLDFISSANIACGFHAGDPSVMQNTVNMAIRKGVAIGAHPGLPDLQGFGRREMKISPKEAYQITLYQIGALSAFVKVENGNLNHVKPHGALYNMAARDASLALAIAQAVKDFNPRLLFFGLSGSEMILQGEKIGLKTVSEVFADRTYQDDGSLTPRTKDYALIKDENLAIQQVLMMIKSQSVISHAGHTISIKAETICLHGDGPHALNFAQKIHQTLKMEDIPLQSPIY